MKSGNFNKPIPHSSGDELSSYVFGKVQPQAIPLEEAVLGAIMLEKDALSIVLDILRAESFYHPAHKLIFQSMMRLFEKMVPVDLLTVTEELKKSGDLEAVGGAFYLVELTNRVGSSANLEYHARIVEQKAMQRSLIQVSAQLIKDAYEDTTDTFELMQQAEQGIFAVTQGGYQRAVMEPDSLTRKYLQELEAAKGREDGLTGVPSGFTALDRLTGGWQRPDLIIVAARPGMGKTAFVMEMAKNTALDFGKSVAVFSLEMSATQLLGRMVSSHCSINSERLRNGNLEEHHWQEVHTFMERFTGGAGKVLIDDTPSINAFELRAKCRRMKMQHDIQLVVVDYIQLMTGSPDGKRGNREQEVSSISRALKGLAKELDVPVIALSQLSRAVESRGGSKRPMLSDLRESGAIEQDADIVSFIYRPEYYQILEDENGHSLKGVAEIIIAKHRNGALDTVKLGFKDDFARFEDLDDPNFVGIESTNPFCPTQFPASANVTPPTDRNDDKDIPF